MARHRATRDQVDAAVMVRYADAVRATGDAVQLAAPDEVGPVRRALRYLFAGPQPPVETRSITGVPWNQGGVAPTSMDAAKALTLVPVYAAVRLLADTIASLPLHRYRMDKQGKVREQLPDPPLFVKPSVVGTFPDWLHRLVVSMALTGNGYGMITGKDGTGYPSFVEWMNPAEVTVLDQAFDGPGSFLQPLFYWRGRLLNPPGTRWQDAVVHAPWFVQPYRVPGLSPIGAYAKTIATGLSAQAYSNAWFDSGGVPPGKFKNAAKTLDEAEARAVRDRLVNSIRSGKPLVYGADWDYEPIATPPDEAQFIATMQMTATQIASIYGIPPEMIGGTTPGNLNYSTPVLRGDDLVRFCLQPWLARIEAVLSALLPRPQFCAFDTDKLTMPDALTRRQIYLIDTKIGLRSANEMRAAENLAPLPEPLPVALPGHELIEPGGTPTLAPNTPPPAPAAPQPALKAVRGMELERAIGEALHPGATAHLMEYWAHGEGAAKIGWGSPGDYDRCRLHLAKYVPPGRELDGLCANLHHKALGVWPGKEHGKGRSYTDWDLDEKTLQLSLNGDG